MSASTPTEFYHGTSLEAALAIQARGFDVDRSGSNAGAMLGKGLYVTTSWRRLWTTPSIRTHTAARSSSCRSTSAAVKRLVPTTR